MVSFNEEDVFVRGPFVLHLTCNACPEQYDVYFADDPEQAVGYMRLRHGRFTTSNSPLSAEYYVAHPKGDGVFEYDERWEHIDAGLRKIWQAEKGQDLTDDEWEELLSENHEFRI